MKLKHLNTTQKTGFATPKQYFNTFDDAVFNKLQSQHLLEQDLNSGFKVPNDYFGTFEASIPNLSKTQHPKVLKLHTKRLYYSIASIAAAVAIIVSVMQFSTNSTQEPITTSIVQNYLTNSTINSYELAELLLETDVLSSDFNMETTAFTEADLETYLSTQSDIEFLLTE